jgi:hypothetical protein
LEPTFEWFLTNSRSVGKSARRLDADFNCRLSTEDLLVVHIVMLGWVKL